MTNSFNLREINQEEAINLCQFYIRSGQNMLMLGRRGIAKTAIAMQSIKECGFKINYINLSVLDRSDLAGFPSLFETGDIVNYKSPYYLPTLKDNQKSDCVLLFDEVDKAQQEVMQPLLEILQFRKINGKPLNAFSCILTGNLINENANSNLIPSTILDRTSKYILSFDFQKWLDWAKLNNIHDLILGFLSSNPNLACGEIEDTNMASPSPRGWSLASEALIQAHKNKITDVNTITSIVAGFVGENAAIQFQQWYSYSRNLEKHILVLIETGFCNIDYHKLDPTEQLVFAIMACYIAKNKVLEKTGKKRLKYLDYLCKFFIDTNVAPEVQLISMINAFSPEMIVKEKLYECKSFLALHTSLTNITENTK